MDDKLKEVGQSQDRLNKLLEEYEGHIKVLNAPLKKLLNIKSISLPDTITFKEE